MKRQKGYSQKYDEALKDLNRYLDNKGGKADAYLLRSKILHLKGDSLKSCMDLDKYEQMTGTSLPLMRTEVCGK